MILNVPHSHIPCSVYRCAENLVGCICPDDLLDVGGLLKNGDHNFRTRPYIAFMFAELSTTFRHQLQALQAGLAPKK